ncbi:MAG TPA: HesA/MoeB/ThiF family protein [Polyangiaceae bacterium]|nr:HesA/MoeB/ThiF family protein [Polyangiaceae bacterium]
MSTSSPERDALQHKSALVVGVGGLGCPAALALAEAGLGRIVLCDDDLVESTNLHRQILFDETDVGTDKLRAAERGLYRLGARPGSIELVHSRFLPDNARELARSVDVVLEGADNFATKFLCADACFLERRPVVHGAAVRLRATVLSVAATGAPCYRCLFEDLPTGAAAPNCAEAGVLGPVVGFAGALLADRALSVLLGDTRVFGNLVSFDGKTDRARELTLAARPRCALCSAEPSISSITYDRYTAANCAA